MAAESQSEPLSDYVQLTRQQWQQQLHLFSLEAQRAAESMTMIWVLGLFLALVILSSWIITLLLTAQALLIVGLTPWQTLSVLLLFQAIAFVICVRRIRYLSQFLGFPASFGQAQSYTHASGHASSTPPDVPPPTANPPPPAATGAMHQACPVDDATTQRQAPPPSASAASYQAAVNSAFATAALLLLAPKLASAAVTAGVPEVTPGACCPLPSNEPAAPTERQAAAPCTKEAPCSPSNYR